MDIRIEEIETEEQGESLMSAGENEETDLYMSGFLQPRLDRLHAMLMEEEIDHRYSLADGSIPGIWVEEPDMHPVFCTYVKETLTKEEPGYLRFSAEKNYEASESDNYIRWIVPEEEVEEADGFLRCLELFYKGYPFRLLPSSDMAVTEEELETDPGENVPPLTYEGMGYAALVRLMQISNLLSIQNIEQTGVLTGKLPYIQIDYMGHILTLFYESTDQENMSFLFHIREDVPLNSGDGDIDTEELARRYNAESFFTRLILSEEAFPVFAAIETEGEMAALHACFPEYGGVSEWERFERIISIFIKEAENAKMSYWNNIDSK